MIRCPECAQMLAEEAKACHACGHDVRVRRMAEPTLERDPATASEQLLAATIANTGIGAPPPPWVAPLSDRLAPRPDDPAAQREVRDVLPEHVAPSRRRLAFWRS